MKYTEALVEAIKGRRIRHEDFFQGKYVFLNEEGFWEDIAMDFGSLNKKLMKSDKWEVEPEEPEPKKRNMKKEKLKEVGIFAAALLDTALISAVGMAVVCVLGVLIGFPGR